MRLSPLFNNTSLIRLILILYRTCQYCPGPMLSAEGFGRIVQAGLTGLQLEHKDAQKGILTFFERLVELPKSPEHAATTAPLVTQVAPHVVQMLLLCLSGQMPLSAISGNNGSVSDVLWNLREFSPPGLEVCDAVMPRDALSFNCFILLVILKHATFSH